MYLLAYSIQYYNSVLKPNVGGESMKGTEKRKEARYSGMLPVELESGKGITRDFSVSGIFFKTDRSFSLGQPIEFTLVLEYIDPKRPVRVKCLGEIVRVVESGPKIGVAATFCSYTFEGVLQHIYR
jgi:hypothetical protein